MLRNPLVIISVAALFVAGCQPVGEPASKAAVPQAAPRALVSERDRASYVVGLDLAKNVAPVKDEVDIELVVQALRDAHAGRAVLLDAAQADEARRQFTQHLRERREQEQVALAAKNRDAGAAFLATNAKEQGVRVTASGLQYRVLREASGPRPNEADTVRVDYIGRLLDGRAFEDTYAIDHSASFALSQVMPGLGEALRLMPVGAKYRFWLPAELAYAEHGLPGQIEPNATLVFEIELLEIAGMSGGESAAARE
jgi:FKBP-type peptidyl-prolyl cis-trans isomerase FkpA